MKKVTQKLKNHNRNFAIESGLLSLYKLHELRNYQAHVGYVGCVVFSCLLCCVVCSSFMCCLVDGVSPTSIPYTCLECTRIVQDRRGVDIDVWSTLILDRSVPEMVHIMARCRDAPQLVQGSKSFSKLFNFELSFDYLL